MKSLIKIRKSVMLFVKILIVAAVTVGFIQVWVQGYSELVFENRGNYVVALSYVLLFCIFSSLYSAFKIGIYRTHEIIYSFSLAIIFTNSMMYLELCLIAAKMVSVIPMLLGTAYQVLVILLCSICANTIYFKLYPPRKVVAIFGDDFTDFELIKKMGEISERFKVECAFNVNTTDMDRIKRQIDKQEAVVICGIDKNLQKEILSYCYVNEKRSYLLPDITDIIISNSHSIQISDTPVLRSRNCGLALDQRIIKRTMDVVISAIGIALTSPIMLICAIAIKLDDGGPIFYRQNRIAINGKIFNIIKFRSMIVGADKDGAKKAENNDSRITRVGKFIRACRIDELPQLFNVLRGDMSLVGPRPERIENVYEYSNKYPEFELRHRVKAGLTGFAQIYGKYNTSPEDKLNMDLIYIETYSLLLDLKLLVLTIKVLFMRESTEGFKTKANENVYASKSLKEESRKENEL